MTTEFAKKNKVICRTIRVRGDQTLEDLHHTGAWSASAAPASPHGEASRGRCGTTSTGFQLTHADLEVSGGE